MADMVVASKANVANEADKAIAPETIDATVTNGANVAIKVD